jgi:hypothetical protein
LKLLLFTETKSHASDLAIANSLSQANRSPARMVARLRRATIRASKAIHAGRQMNAE